LLPFRTRHLFQKPSQPVIRSVSMHLTVDHLALAGKTHLSRVLCGNFSTYHSFKTDFNACHNFFSCAAVPIRPRSSVSCDRSSFVNSRDTLPVIRMIRGSECSQNVTHRLRSSHEMDNQDAILSSGLVVATSFVCLSVISSLVRFGDWRLCRHHWRHDRGSHLTFSFTMRHSTLSSISS